MQTQILTRLNKKSQRKCLNITENDSKLLGKRNTMVTYDPEIKHESMHWAFSVKYNIPSLDILPYRPDLIQCDFLYIQISIKKIQFVYRKKTSNSF